MPTHPPPPFLPPGAGLPGLNALPYRLARLCLGIASFVAGPCGHQPAGSTWIVACSGGPDSVALLAMGAGIMLLALLVNWMLSAAIGHLAAVPERGFIGAESRFESVKLHTAIERYRFQTGEWPTSLDKVRSALPVGRGERNSTLGVEYGYRARGGGYELWLRDESAEPTKRQP